MTKNISKLEMTQIRAGRIVANNNRRRVRPSTIINDLGWGEPSRKKCKGKSDSELQDSK